MVRYSLFADHHDQAENPMDRRQIKQEMRTRIVPVGWGKRNAVLWLAVHLNDLLRGGYLRNPRRWDELHWSAFVFLFGIPVTSCLGKKYRGSVNCNGNKKENNITPCKEAEVSTSESNSEFKIEAIAKYTNQIKNFILSQPFPFIPPPVSFHAL